ncbi:MAG TPA: methyl-accepting chemotaxis protein [Gammaproteobacteria bacterium]|nr:methyl-accepting chemotaxis protein [Gammaproteobacteria bacterium]
MQAPENTSLSRKFQQAFSGFKIRHKLWMGFGILVLLLAIVSITSLGSLSRAQQNLHGVVDVSQPMVLASMELAAMLDRTNSALGFYLLSHAEDERQEYENNLIRLGEMAQAMMALNALEGNPELTGRVEKIVRDIGRYSLYRERMLQLAEDFNLNQPGIGFSASQMEPVASEIQQYLNQMLSSEAEQEASSERKQLLLELAELRQTWMNVLNNNRAFIAFRVEANRSNAVLFREGFVEALERIAGYSDLLSFEQEDAVSVVRDAANRYIELQDELFRVHSSNQWRTDSYLIRTEIGPLAQEIRQDIDWLVRGQREEVEGSTQSLLVDVTTTKGLIGTLLLLGLVFGGGGALLLARSITRPMEIAVQAMEDISEGEGDLTRRLQVQGKDEMAQLSTSFNKFIDKIQEMVQQVSGATTQLAAAAEEMSIITSETSQGVYQQRSETEQVATAMTEMTATVQEVAGNAESAAETASEADSQAASGRSVVNNTINSIGRLAQEVETASDVISRLEKDSEKIGAVLSVIQGIAEQTNLLALNAAIEAARAGEQGRGFAVVADEVRNLASRTQSSAGEIRQMIEALQTGARNAVAAMEAGRSQAQSSVEQADNAGQALQSIASAVNKIKDMNQQIAEAARQQGQVAEDINQSVINITHIADSSSTGTEQLAEASHDLARLSSELQTLVGSFKV